MLSKRVWSFHYQHFWWYCRANYQPIHHFRLIWAFSFGNFDAVIWLLQSPILLILSFPIIIAVLIIEGFNIWLEERDIESLPLIAAFASASLNNEEGLFIEASPFLNISPKMRRTTSYHGNPTLSFLRVLNPLFISSLLWPLPFTELGHRFFRRRIRQVTLVHHDHQSCSVLTVGQGWVQPLLRAKSRSRF